MAQFKSITEYIPQSAPMVMVGEVIAASEKSLTTTFLIEESNVLVSNGVLTEGGLIENIAQTAAAHNGYHQAMGATPAVGYIGALKDVKIYGLPKVNEQLTTTIEIIGNVMGATIIMGKTFCGVMLLAECEMKIFMKEHAPA